MVPKSPSRTAFVVVATSGLLSATLGVSAAAQEQRRDDLSGLAAPERAGVVAAAATIPVASAIPKLAGFYTFVEGTARLRVAFVQDAEMLTATWMDPLGQHYGRGTYRWDAATGAFKGTSTTRHVCLDDPGQPSATVLVREELYVMSDRELRDRWTKPLAVDCSVGMMEVFRWTDHTWLATDSNWQPIGSPLDPPEPLIGAR